MNCKGWVKSWQFLLTFVLIEREGWVGQNSIKICQVIYEWYLSKNLDLISLTNFAPKHVKENFYSPNFWVGSGCILLSSHEWMHTGLRKNGHSFFFSFFFLTCVFIRYFSNWERSLNDTCAWKYEFEPIAIAG